MTTLIVLLLIIWLAVAFTGAFVEGLMWLLIIGAILFVLTGLFGWSRRGRTGPPA